MSKEDNVYFKDLPEIYTEERKAVNGQIIESKFIKVKGKTLNECKKIYDKLK